MRPPPPTPPHTSFLEARLSSRSGRSRAAPGGHNASTDRALATLDLVIPDLEQGNTAAVQALADDMVTVFRAHNVSREALAAVLLFQEAARRETATTTFARETAASLSRARESSAKLP